MQINDEFHAPAALPLGIEHQSTRAGLEAIEKSKTSCSCRNSNPGSPAHRRLLNRLSYPGILNLIVSKDVFLSQEQYVRVPLLYINYEMY
jgi:hypothetical protein